jgi:hypothetical protein
MTYEMCMLLKKDLDCQKTFYFFESIFVMGPLLLSLDESNLQCTENITIILCFLRGFKQATSIMVQSAEETI